MKSANDSVLVIQTAFIGDLLLSIPLLKNIRRLWPQSPLVLVCRKGLGEFFLKKGIVDEVFEVQKKPAANWTLLFEELRDRKFKFIFCPHQSFRSESFVWRMNSANKIGYKKWWNPLFFTYRVERPMRWPEVLRQMELIRHLSPEIDRELNGANNGSWFEPDCSPKIPEIFSLQLEKQPAGRDKTVFLAPGSEWPTKRWDPKGFGEVGNYFKKKGYEVVITGSKSESDLNQGVANLIPGSKDLTGRTTLLELYERFRNGHLLVSNDSGASHLASCAGLPVVAIFGPTVPSFGYRPWHDSAQIVQLDLDCRPCSAHGARTCPLGTHECMVGLGSQRVILACNEVGK